MALYLAELRCGLQRAQIQSDSIVLAPPQQPVVFIPPPNSPISKGDSGGVRSNVQVLVCLHSVALVHSKEKLDQFTALHMFMTIGERTEHRVLQCSVPLSDVSSGIDESFMFALPQPLPLKLNLFLSGENGSNGEFTELGQCMKTLPTLKQAEKSDNAEDENAISCIDHTWVYLKPATKKKPKTLKFGEESDESIEVVDDNETNNQNRQSKISMSLTTLSPQACASVIMNHREVAQQATSSEDSLDKLRAVAKYV